MVAGLLILGACHLLLGGTPVYWADATKARVIDETTGRPLAGVAVLASWEMASVLEGEGETLYRDAAVTDASGTFVIPPMPLRLRWPLHFLRNHDPLLRIYKPGYAVERLTNSDRYPYLGPHSHAPRRRSYWTGKTIPLQPKKDTAGEVRSFEIMRSEVVNAELDPAEYPGVWSVLREGYRRLPAGASYDEDPAVTVQRWGTR